MIDGKYYVNVNVGSTDKFVTMASARKYKIKKIKVLRFEEHHSFYTTKKRSKLMFKIRAKEITPEIALRKALWKRGIRYRKNYGALPGTPAIIIRKLHLVIFIDGEFWHRYNWQEKKRKSKQTGNSGFPKLKEICKGIRKMSIN